MKITLIGIGAILLGIGALIFAFNYIKKGYKSPNQPIAFQAIGGGIMVIIAGIIILLKHHL